MIEGQKSSLTLGVEVYSNPAIGVDDGDIVPRRVAPALLDFTLVFDFEGAESLVHRHQISSWSDDMYDLLDCSLCLTCLSQSDDTTEDLNDTLSDYAHTTQWAMYQNFFGAEFLFYSKTNKYVQNERFLTVYFHPQDLHSGASTGRLMRTTPDDVRDFAAALYKVHKEIREMDLM